MLNSFNVTPGVINYIRFLIVIFTFAAVSVVSLLFWQINEQKNTANIKSNYHLSSSLHIEAVRTQILIIKSHLDKKSNNFTTDENLYKGNRNIQQALYVIEETVSDIGSIQKKYNDIKFNGIINQLNSQLVPLIEHIKEIKSGANKDIVPHEKDFSAVILTLNQFDRLHVIAYQELSRKVLLQEKKHISIMVGFISIIGLVIGVITWKSFKSIKGILNKQKIIEKKLGKEKELINTMLDSIDDAVITINEDGMVLSFNKRAEALFKCRSSEIIGENVKCLMPEPDSSNHDEYLRRYTESGEAHSIGRSREVIALRTNKETFPMSLTLAELPRGDDGKRRFIGSCRDLTKAKQQEEQLRRTQKMDALGKLTGGIAHDFNNMLGIMIGYAELLEAKLSDQPKLSKYASEIHHAGDRGALLTNKLLAFSSKKARSESVININKTLIAQRNMLEKTLTARIKLNFYLEEELWTVYADVNDLEDAILNLSINAMHAMQGSGQISFHTSNEIIDVDIATSLGLDAAEYVVLSVSDIGCGMSESTRNQIFDPFYTTKGNKGTGLGLSQVYGFMERSKGAIKVYSELNRGTQFNLYFPRYHKADDNEQTQEQSHAADYAGNETILIVDDEASLIKLTAEIISQQGYKVVCAQSAQQALQVLERESIDLLLSDIIMPDMDGYELASIVKARYPKLKIQLASGFAYNKNISLISEGFQQNIVNKPYNSIALLKRLRNLLDGEN